MRKIFYQWAGVGIITLIGFGVDMIPNNESWIPSIIIWIIAGIWFVGTIVYIFKNKKTTVNDSKTKLVCENLVDTLTAMHRRLETIREQKAKKMNITYKQFTERMPLLANTMGTIQLKDRHNFKKEYKKRLLKRIPPKPRIYSIKRNYFKLWAKWRSEVYFASINLAEEMKEEMFHSKEWDFEDGIKISDWLDSVHWGVQQLRDNDNQWISYQHSISHYYSDPILCELIGKAIDFSKFYHNQYLIVQYSRKFANNEFSKLLHDALIGSPISMDNTERALSNIYQEINKRLTEISENKGTS